MSNYLNKNTWLIGAGQMAMDYQKILKDLGVPFKVLGRGRKSAKLFYESTGYKPFQGGLKKFLSSRPKPCTYAIVAVSIEMLHETTLLLLKYGVKNILVEKPAGINRYEIQSIGKLAKEKNANVIIGYNRRFYASVLKAKEIIKISGGIKSFNFEFTEWANKIKKLKKASGVKKFWFLGNSTHIVDLAFYLGGEPKEISSFVCGKLDWHPSASIFSGAGKSKSGALFSYQANWESAGRWSLHLLTKKNRLILCPLEKLQIQKIDSVKIDFVSNIDYSLDINYKPGLFLQTSNFLKGKFDSMVTIKDFNKVINHYYNIANYKIDNKKE